MNYGQAIRAIASLVTLGLLTGCAGSSLGDNVQQSLEADPQLEESAPFGDDAADSETDRSAAEATSEDSDIAATDTAPASDATNSPRRRELTPPDYTRSSYSTPRSTAQSTATTQPSESRGSLKGVPADLQPYLRDLQALAGVELAITSRSNNNSTASTGESPFTQTITRREYARWLFETYNAIYADEPGERLRLGNSSDDPIFQDVTSEDSDFAVIQGLAAAGLIPSAVAGNSTDVNFRPDAPLTRADLILWKVPLDTRAALPTTTPEAVKTAWGFQDVDSVEALALRAIAADFQLGDFANFSRAFGYTTLFRPEKTVSRAEAAAVLWRFGTQTEGVSAADLLAD
ncbi:S-layer homology domain-containing protein [Leptolyngbya iicbica]|uniref:S-layer homology domain-containing protein n=2 Tax=Cyanophyceae TaxID=3028117 RepID=A0A4Q7E3M8_9CYAN|nr:S-layer homology domain-containing protein [Leptolyngbya sp. LK]RZM76521.1 S-layer homology domain-containing protein [Leptolyngbya sp. LK]